MIRRFLALAVLLPVIAWAGNYHNVVIIDKPLDFYELDEASGTTANDTSALATVNGTYHGTFTLSQSGIPGNGGATAVAFVTNGYVDTGTSNNFNVVSTGGTFEAWIKFVSNAQYIFFNNAGGASFTSKGSEMFTGSGTNKWRVVIWGNNSSNDCSSGGDNYGDTGEVGTFTTGTWQHFVCTMTIGAASGGGVTLTHLKIYNQGTLTTDDTTFAGSGVMCNNNNGHGIQIGRRGDGAGFINGTMDEVAWYSDQSGATGVLSATRVLAHYLAGITGGAAAWPYTVKRPELPRFRDDGYFDKLVKYGYHTGQFTREARMPQFIGFYPALAVVPDGNVK